MWRERSQDELYSFRVALEPLVLAPFSLRIAQERG
jgi:hypothetical protein